MSNEFKLVPVEPTDAMVRAGMGVGDDNCLYWKHPQQAYVDMLAAAPQTPALSGELKPCGEVLGVCYDHNLKEKWEPTLRFDKDANWGEIHLIYSDSSVAPLQAEIERLKDNVREVTTYRDNAIKKIERLRNELTGTEKECDQLKALLFLANAALEGRIDDALSKPAGSEPRIHPIREAGMKLIDEAIGKDGMPS